MGKRRKALESSLALMDYQYFRALSAIESFWRLVRTTGDQLVTGECLELLRDLGEEIQAWACYSDFAYRHLQEWPVYVDERDVSVAFHLWNCSECEATAALDSPEDVGLRCFRRETGRTRQRRAARRYIGRRWR